MNATSRSRARRALAATAAAVPGSRPAGAVCMPHARASPTTASTTAPSRARLVELREDHCSPRTPVSRSTWRSCPTGGSCTPPATAPCGSSTRTPASRRSSTRPAGLHQLRGRPADRHARPRLRHEQVGLPLLRAAHDDGRAVRSRYPTTTPRHRRRTRLPAGADARPTGTSGRATTSSPASSGTTPPTSSTSRPSRSSSRSRSSAGSAATSPATSTSTPTATSTSRPATTRRPARRAPTASRRTTTPRASTPASTRVAAPATPTTCAARSCASRSRADGSYTVPAGNLFAPGTAKTRPEIFVMGLRNPFRIDVDPADQHRLVGRLRPRRRRARPASRGPMGYVEWQTTAIDKPLNGGWPYCTGPNANYNEWNFATATPGPWFDCAAGPQQQLARWNTGLAPAAAGHRAARSTTATTTRTSRGPS